MIGLISIVLDSRISVDRHFDTLEQGEQFIKELMSDE